MANIDVKITDNSEAVKNALASQIEAALIAIGLTAESYAKDKCPVDTGRLINSITFALAGQSANTPTYTDNYKNEYSYKGKAPKDEKSEYSVYIGSNVEYAA